MSMAVQKPTSRRTRPNVKLQGLSINAGLSANDLAYRAGVSGNTIRAVFGGTVPHPRTQRAIADVFGVEPLDLWPLEDQR